MPSAAEPDGCRAPAAMQSASPAAIADRFGIVVPDVAAIPD
jgi:hypothetical protein